MALPERRAVLPLGRDLNTNAETLEEQLGPTNILRARAAIDRWQELSLKGLQPWFIPSGKGLAGLQNPRMIEADKLGVFAVREGVLAHLVKPEIFSLDTWGNAIHTCLMMAEMGIREAEYFTSSWTADRARIIIEHTLGSDFAASVIGVPEAPTAHDLRGEASGLQVALRVIGNSEQGNIPSIQDALAQEMEIYRRPPLAAAA